jgi:hypothetical protein
MSSSGDASRTVLSAVMRDVFDFGSAPDILGRLANSLFLTRYLRHFLVTGNELIKDTAETDRWTRYLPRPNRALQPTAQTAFFCMFSLVSVPLSVATYTLLSGG